MFLMVNMLAEYKGRLILRRKAQELTVLMLRLRYMWGPKRTSLSIGRHELSWEAAGKGPRGCQVKVQWRNSCSSTK